MRFFPAFALILLTFSVRALSQEPPEILPLNAGFEAMRLNDWEKARAAASPAGQAAVDLIEWHRLREGHGTFAEYTAFLARNPDWPGLPLLRQKGEAAISSRISPKLVIAYFADQGPRTGHGALELARAYEKQGQSGDAAAGVVLAWRRFILTRSETIAFLRDHKKLLAPHHLARLDMLLWRGRPNEARRMFPLVNDGWRALAQARIALRRKGRGVDSLIKAVPEELQQDPGLAYERFLWRARKGLSATAMSLLLERSISAETLGEPAKWADRRRSLARQMMREGDGTTAYRIASSHYLAEGSQFADLEWLSGYLALRYLNDPKTALAHFQSFRRAVKTPISLGRAGYWLGRAHEAMGNMQEAHMAYADAGQFQTSFYGLLAAEKAGLSMDATLTGLKGFSDWRQAGFMSSSVLKAALLLYQAGERVLAKRFFLHLAEGLNQHELGQLADLALSLRDPHIALMIAKQAAGRGHVLPRAYYPLHDLAKETLPVAMELAMAIARRESEFNTGATSGAGAQGLMQLMPRTAKSVAKELEIEYEARRLTSDWRYNARLGSAYLARLQSEFGGSPVLVAAGYNAGPSRARAWIKAFGDPRSAGTDVVDWIEHIPFRETRNYVMRVAESLPVYRARLTGKTPPLSLSAELHKGG